MSHAIPLRFRCSARGGVGRLDGRFLAAVPWSLGLSAGEYTDAGEETAAVIARGGGGEWCGGCRGWGRDGMALRKGKSSPRQWEG
nr:unnamed protein product [Digitaria exilis]